MSRNEKSSLNYFGSKIMREESLNRLLGKQCKIVTKEPGDKINHIVIGIIMEIEYNEKFIIIESNHGVSCLSIQSIVAIKPWKQYNI